MLNTTFHFTWMALIEVAILAITIWVLDDWARVAWRWLGRFNYGRKLAGMSILIVWLSIRLAH